MLFRSAVLDFARRIFPVNTETVVIPYFPVQNDMVKVKGDADEVWRARVIDFSLRRKIVQGRFFVQRDHRMACFLSKHYWNFTGTMA